MYYLGNNILMSLEYNLNELVFFTCKLYHRKYLLFEQKGRVLKLFLLYLRQDWCAFESINLTGFVTHTHTHTHHNTHTHTHTSCLIIHGQQERV